MKLNHNRAVLLMVGVTLLWSTAGVVTRQLESARSFEITFWRSAFTALSLLVILPFFQGRQVFRPLFQGTKTFWISGICWSVMFTAFMLALTMTSVANVLITMSLGPLLTALVARIFIGHRIPLRTWIAIFVAGMGIVYMYAAQVAEASLVATLVTLCVPLAGAVNWTVTQNSHAQGHDVDLIPAVLVGAVLSTAMTLPLAYPFQATSHDLIYLAFLGLGQLAIPCVLSVMCARILKAPEISLLALLEVVFGIVLAWVGAHEVPRDSVLIGGIVVISALLVNELVAWRNRG